MLIRVFKLVNSVFLLLLPLFSSRKLAVEFMLYEQITLAWSAVACVLVFFSLALSHTFSKAFLQALKIFDKRFGFPIALRHFKEIPVDFRFEKHPKYD